MIIHRLSPAEFASSPFVFNVCVKWCLCPHKHSKLSVHYRWPFMFTCIRLCRIKFGLHTHQKLDICGPSKTQICKITRCRIVAHCELVDKQCLLLLRATVVWWSISYKKKKKRFKVGDIRFLLATAMICCNETWLQTVQWHRFYHEAYWHHFVECMLKCFTIAKLSSNRTSLRIGGRWGKQLRSDLFSSFGVLQRWNVILKISWGL